MVVHCGSFGTEESASMSQGLNITRTGEVTENESVEFGREFRSHVLSVVAFVRLTQMRLYRQMDGTRTYGGKFDEVRTSLVSTICSRSYRVALSSQNG